MLKFNKILGYYRSGAVAFLLEDGRYAMTNVHHYSKASGGRVEISSTSICFLRGKEITNNIPDSYEDKIREILNNPNTKLSFEYVGGPIISPITVKEYLKDSNMKDKVKFRR